VDAARVNLNVKGSVLTQWEGFVEHHDFCFSVVNAPSTSLCPFLPGIYHGFQLVFCRGSCYNYHVINVDQGSNPDEVVNGSDFRKFEQWEFGSQFNDELRHTNAKEGRAGVAAFGKATENFHFICVVNDSMQNPYLYTSGVLFLYMPCFSSDCAVFNVRPRCSLWTNG